MVKVEIRKANSGDLDVLIPVVAKAFQPQPLTCWLLGSGSSALERSKRLIALEFEKALPYDLIYTTNCRHGAALWHPPDKKIDLWRELVWSLKSAAAVGISRRTLSHIITGLQLAIHQPKGLLYYLSILGVDPNFQGEGIGSALMEPGLLICDEQRTPAYLVTDTQNAVRFYQRKGFRVIKQINAYRAGFRIWIMLRNPSRF
jgi:ribosomal protein S18 acetylase RimI-like enzyme